jgi:Skp family chaperone for outer membrane proteins
MSRRQNVTPSDELAKRKTKIAEMEQELAAERERVRKGEEEAERAREIAEAQRRAAEARQQQARENRARVELPRRSASPVALRSGASGSVSRCVSSFLLQCESWHKG